MFRALIAIFTFIILTNQICVADTPTEPILRIETGMHVATLKRVGVSADGKILMTASSDDKTVRLWSLPDGKLMRTLRVPIDNNNGGETFAAAISPDGKIVASGGWDAQVYIFDTNSGEIIERLSANLNGITQLTFSADGQKLAAGMWTGLRVWQTSDWSEIGADQNYGEHIPGLSFASDGRLASASFDGFIRVYDSKVVLQKKVKAPSGGQPNRIAFSPDGKSLAVGYFRKPSNVDVLSSDTLERLFQVNLSASNEWDLQSVAWSNDGKTLFAGGMAHIGNDQPIVAWADGGKGSMKLLPGPKDTITDLFPMGEKGVAYVGGGPYFGVIGNNGKKLFAKGPVGADLRGSLGANFTASADTSRVRFGLEPSGRDPWVFDVSNLTLSPSKIASKDLHRPLTTGLPLTNWEYSEHPKFEERIISFPDNDRALSLSIFKDLSGFIFGTGRLNNFDSKGNLKWMIGTASDVWGVNTSDDGKIIVAAIGGGTIRWYRTSDGKELLALFVYVPDKRWVLWTPTGYYAASPGGEDLIGWHVNRGLDKSPDFFSASRFRDQFYRPDIVQLMLETLDEEKSIDIANEKANLKKSRDLKDSLPPVIKIQSPCQGESFSDREVIFDYSLRSPSGMPIDGVQVLIDGRPARGLESIETQKSFKPESEMKGQVKVLLPARNVEVGFIAKSGNVTSEASLISLKWKGDEPSAEDLLKPKLYALVVGVSDYQKSELTLKYAAKDATDFARSLEAQKGGLYGDVTIKLLTNAEATGDAVIDGLSWLEKEVTSRDVGILFIAGHGKTDEKNRYYFLPFDVDPKKLRSSAVSRDDISETLGSMAGKAIAFLDTCHSGAIGRGDVDTTAIINEFTTTERGAIVFASSTGREISQEDDSWGNGAFTKALVEGLGTKGKPGAADLIKDGKITTSELDAFITDRVKTLTKATQHPVMIRPATIPDFPISVVR